VAIISVKEARKILGKTASGMTDEEIEELVENLDVIAVHALKDAREKRMKEDASAMAELIYDIYQDKKHSPPDNRDKKE
jgi:hypothetical protein